MFNRLYSATFVFLSLASLAYPTRGQEIALGLNIGYATFNMQDIRNLQSQLCNSYPVDSKIVESFPGYLNMSGNVYFNNPNIYYGLYFGHTSTGGRISYSDYSGSLSSDQLITMNYVGPMIATKLSRNSKNNVYLGMQLLYYFNNLKFVEVITLNDASVKLIIN